MIKKISIGNSVNRGMFDTEDSWTVRRAFEEANIAIEGAVTADGIVLTRDQLDDSIAALGNVSYLRSVPAKADAYKIKVLGTHARLESDYPYADWKKVTPFSCDTAEGLIATGIFPAITKNGVTFADNGTDNCVVEFELESSNKDAVKDEIFEKYGSALDVLDSAEAFMIEGLEHYEAEKDAVVRNVVIF